MTLREIAEICTKALTDAGLEVTSEGGSDISFSYGLVATAEDRTKTHASLSLVERSVPDPDELQPGVL